MIEVLVTIGKSDISPLGLLKGFANDAAFCIGETIFPAGTLEFAGFVGAIDMETMDYVGIIYLAAGESKSRRADFSLIETILNPGESDDVLHSLSN